MIGSSALNMRTDALSKSVKKPPTHGIKRIVSPRNSEHLQTNSSNTFKLGSTNMFDNNNTLHYHQDSSELYLNKVDTR